MDFTCDSRLEEKIDWRNAPAGARWWSVEKNGNACWHLMGLCDPLMAFVCAATLPAPKFGFDGDWRESLVERPVADLASTMHCLLRTEN